MTEALHSIKYARMLTQWSHKYPKHPSLAAMYLIGPRDDNAMLVRNGKINVALCFLDVHVSERLFT